MSKQTKEAESSVKLDKDKEVSTNSEASIKKVIQEDKKHFKQSNEKY